MCAKRVLVAIADFTEAIELQPGFGQAYYQRGLLHLRRDENASALKDIEKAQELGVEVAPSVLERLEVQDALPEAAEGLDGS